MRNRPHVPILFLPGTLAFTLILLATFAPPVVHARPDSSKRKVLQLPMRTDGPKSLDPIRGSTVYDNQATSQVYDTLVQYKYFARPLELEPLLLTEMPKISTDRRTYRFKLRERVRFHDDPCFPGGKGRELVSSDVFYSWKRMADQDNLPKSWWLFEDTVVGFDEYRAKQNAAAKFDYDAPVAGFRVIDDREFEVVLKKPVYRFMWVLAMFQTSIVAREAAEKYGERFGRHPVGTGPFLLEKEEDWVPQVRITFKRNPNYYACFYPNEGEESDRASGWLTPAGTRLPIVDEVTFTMFVQDQPRWLQFEAGKIGSIQVPAEFFEKAFRKRTKKIKSSYSRKGITAQALPLYDFIFIGFNMEDPLLGGYTPEKRYLRQAISLAMDWDERNHTFYNGTNVVFDGPIPVGLDGHPENGRAPRSYRGPDLDRARELLAKAGYPDGKGLPAIDYYTSRGGNIPEQTELLTRQLGKIGVRVNPRLVDFSTLIEAVNNKKAPLFSFAWGSDYPDGENNLALFYGPNESPGANHFNYKNAEYDKLYEKIISMPPSPERTALYVKMRDRVIEDAPYLGSMGRTRFYLIQPWLKNFKAIETFYNWVKYLDIDESKL